MLARYFAVREPNGFPVLFASARFWEAFRMSGRHESQYSPTRDFVLNDTPHRLHSFVTRRSRSLMSATGSALRLDLSL